LKRRGAPGYPYQTGPGPGVCVQRGRTERDENQGESDVAAVCDVCGKGPGFGMSVSHSHRRTHRRWNPNIQTVRAKIGASQRRRLKVCTSCLKAGKVVRG
jgi:large subunit ribosomal protein L28